MSSKHHLPQYVAEFIGTFFLVFLGCGSIILAETVSGYNASLVPFIWGGSVSLMIYAVGHISGAHFNPAVTIGFWSIGRFPRHKIFGYIFSQFAGAILASSFHMLIWGGEHSFGATSFTTTFFIGFFIEIILSFLLMFVIASVATDSRAVGELAGIAIGTSIALAAFVGGPLTNASMNPARSLGPATLSGDFSSLWPYLLAPVIGTVLGGKVYEWIRCQREVKDDSHGCC